MSNDALLSVLTYIFLNFPVIQTEISFVRGLQLAHYFVKSKAQSPKPPISANHKSQNKS